MYDAFLVLEQFVIGYTVDYLQFRCVFETYE